MAPGGPELPETVHLILCVSIFLGRRPPAFLGFVEKSVTLERLRPLRYGWVALGILWQVSGSAGWPPDHCSTQEVEDGGQGSGVL